MSKQKWIPCIDRLPEHNFAVIARDEFYGTIGEAFMHRGGGWEFAGPRKDDCSVTHWMPFPRYP